MPAELTINGKGEVRRFPLDDLAQEFAEFKEDVNTRLKYRKDRMDRGPALDMLLYDYINSLAKRKDVVPQRGTKDYDTYIDRLWKQEPILAGTVYGMVSKAQTKPWKIEGGRNNTTRVARMLNNAKYSYYKDGWAGFAGMSALDYYTTRIGQVWSVFRRGTEGPLTGIEHVDALSCVLTRSYTKPVRYMSAATGQQIRFKADQVIQEASLPLTREQEWGYGFCAVERALVAAQLLVGLHDYDLEKLCNLPPEGIAAITGMTYDEFIDCVTNWANQREQDNSKTFPQVLWLLNINNPAEAINVELTPFSTLPEQFDRGVVVEQYVNILANAFGVTASDIWFMGGGPFGTGREVEMQHLYAKGKGEGEWFSKTEQILNREFPPDVQFGFDTDNMEEDLNAAQTAKAWVEALMPLVEQSQSFGIPGDRWMRLFAEKGVVPTWFVDQSEPDIQTIITSDQTQRMKSKDANDLIAFVWELGKLKEVPVITTYRHVETVEKEAPPAIRGMPIPDKEVERGARVTRKAILAEQEIWGEIPELAKVLADEASHQE